MSNKQLLYIRQHTSFALKHVFNFLLPTKPHKNSEGKSIMGENLEAVSYNYVIFKIL